MLLVPLLFRCNLDAFIWFYWTDNQTSNHKSVNIGKTVRVKAIMGLSEYANIDCTVKWMRREAKPLSKGTREPCQVRSALVSETRPRSGRESWFFSRRFCFDPSLLVCADRIYEETCEPCIKDPGLSVASYKTNTDSSFQERARI